MRVRALFPVLMLALGSIPAAAQVAFNVAPSGETTPFPGASLKGGDTAVWLHPTDRSKSLVLGVDGQSALYLYALDGSSAGSYPGAFSQVDVRYGFPLGTLQPALVALLGTEGSLTFATVDPTTRAVTNVSGSGVNVGAQPGCARIFHVRGSAAYELVTTNGTEVKRWALGSSNGKVTATPIATYPGVLSGPATACASDEALSRMYVVDGVQGLSVLDFLGDGGLSATLVAQANVSAELGSPTAVAVYPGGGQGGYLAVASNAPLGGGRTVINFFERQSLSIVADFQVTAPGVSVESTRGLAFSGLVISDAYSPGLLVVHDGTNSSNFKLVSLGNVSNAADGGRSSDGGVRLGSLEPAFDPRDEGAVSVGPDAGERDGGGPDTQGTFPPGANGKEGGKIDYGGCGCSHAPSVASLGLISLLTLAFVLRRRP